MGRGGPSDIGSLPRGPGGGAGMRADATPALFGAWGRDALQVARDNKLLDLYLEMQAESHAPSREREASRQSRNAIQQTIAALVSCVEAGGVVGGHL